MKMEETIYLQQAVTMLRNEKDEERDRWLDWVLSYILNPDTQIEKINVNLRKEIFSILSAVFLLEIHHVSETHPTPQCSENLLSYLLQGRGYALVLSMVRIPEKGSCPLELTILLLFLASRLIIKIKLENILPKPEDLEVEVPLFSQEPSAGRVKKKKGPRKRGRKPVSGFPEKLDRQGTREFENLAEYETSSETESEEDYLRGGTLRINHINYLTYFDHGDMDSDAVIRNSRVAPPASFSTVRNDRLRTSGRIFEVRDASSAEAGMITQVLQLAAKVTSGVWSPVSEKDKELSLQIISICEDLIKMDIPVEGRLWTQLEARVVLNCLFNIKFIAHQAKLTSSKGFPESELNTMVKERKCLSLPQWPSICREIITIFLHIVNLHRSHPEFRSNPELACSRSFLVLCRSIVDSISERRSDLSFEDGEIVKLLCSIVQLVSACEVDSRSLWSDLGLSIVSIVAGIDCSRSRVLVLDSLAVFANTRKVSPETYFNLVRKLRYFSDSSTEVSQAYLSMLERTVDNLTDSWDGDKEEEKEEMDIELKVSSNLSKEENLEENPAGFGAYLEVLLCNETSSKELVISHLDAIICTLRSELRLQLATEVILPFLEAKFDRECDDRNMLVSVLDILCTLVQEQPTAMALIREQRAWTSVKKFGSAEGELSNVCQQIIKTLILNSHKFKKIRLSEAEAMALQDDENDRINFDERDRNAQYWLFKQLYHVLVQSSNIVLTSGWPTTINHLTTAWQVTLELVRRVPEFFVFAVERGITDINVQLTECLLSEKGDVLLKDFADLLGALLNFQVYVIVNFDLMNEELLHININQTKDMLIEVLFPKIQSVLLNRKNIWFCKVLLSSVLDSSYVTELVSRQGENQQSQFQECSESGYEADDSESNDFSADVLVRSGSYRVTFKQSFHFFIDSFLLIFEMYKTEPEFIYTLEYLVFKLVNNCGRNHENAMLFNEEDALTRIYSALISLLGSGFRLENLCDMILVLTENIAKVQLLPSTVKYIFELVGRENELQEKMILSVSKLIKELSPRKEFAGVVAVPLTSRFRAVSASSSDSGLDSTNSSAAMSPDPSNDTLQSRSLSFHDDLGQDYAVVLRVKLNPEVKRDSWLTLLCIENHTETISLHINVQKGLKLTLANSLETIAAAETTFKSMLFPNQWIHLAFNLGTISEGKRETKTLTAFVNCQKVWGVGLCVDKVQSKVRKKDITVTIGPSDPIPDLFHSALIFSDVYLLKNCILSPENVLLNYICAPRDLNGSYSPTDICFRQINQDFQDFLNTCSRIISEPKIMKQHLSLTKCVVAHFSPFSLWRKQETGISPKIEDKWTLLDGLMKAGGAECIALIPLEAVEKRLSIRTISESLSNCLVGLTANQTIFDEFKRIGGFGLISSILTSKTFTPDATILEVLLNASSICMGADKVLLFPEILIVCLQHVERFEKKSMLTVMVDLLKFFSELLSETNPATELNTEMMKSHKVFDSILICLQTFAESCEESLPVEDISNLLSALPPTSEFLIKKMNLVLSTLPPYLLYLPYLSRSLLHVTMVKEKKSSILINKVHTSDVVDASTAIINPPDAVLKRLSEESTLISQSRRGSREETKPFSVDLPGSDTEIYECEEDMVSEWEVLTRENSSSRPATPSAYVDVQRPGNLAAILLHNILSGFTILSDTESALLTDHEYKPETLLPLVGHPSTDVHSPALDLIGLILERSDDSGRSDFLAKGGYYQVAALIQDSTPSHSLVSSILSLLHGHPIDVNVPFEFCKESPPQINLSTVCLLPPLIISSLSILSLGHSILCHVHELLANLPDFTRSLMSEHLLQTLVAGLVKLGDLPEIESDIFGCNQSELLTEDINNILRMLIVFFGDKPGGEYEELLDVLFLASGLLSPTGHISGKPKLGSLSESASNNLRAGICLILEETLLTLEAGLARSGDRFEVPKYFQKEEAEEVDSEQPGTKPVKGRQAACTLLVSRLNQICKFSVNYITSRDCQLIPEEESLALSILALCLDAASYKNPHNNLLKGLNDPKSVGGVLVLHILRFATEKKKIHLIKLLDARENIIILAQEMFPDSNLREHFRFCVLSVMKSSNIFGSGDSSKLVALFYGRILTRQLYPGGPESSFQPSFPVYHTSFGPWKAECFRCVSLFLSQVNQDSKIKASIATKFTEKVVERHDLCRKYYLEQGRERVSSRQKSLRDWRRIIENQTHPLALWHDPAFEPHSLVLENITGLSGTYIRFKRSHSGILKDKFYKEGFKIKSEPEKRRFSVLLGDKGTEENLNSKLDYPEQIQMVESVKEVTPTDVLDCDLVVTEDTLHIFSSSSWTSAISQIESISNRRYQLKNVALEFFLSCGETHLVVFKNQEYREFFVKFMLEAGVSLNPKSENLQGILKKWRQGGISNFQYLSELNSLAGRTPNDLMQYPVFPWILADYNSSHLNLHDPSAFRNLRLPIAIQNKENVSRYETTYQLLNQSETGLPGHMGPYHYASHYSNTGIVLHLLVRLPPFTTEFIKFQDGNFDLADRSFHSLATSWQMVSHVSTSDVKELIPQLFYLPELFENNEGFALGKRQNGKDVDSVVLPPWAPDARIFVKIHRQALESSYVKQELSHWIDLVFGYKQRGPAAVEAVNVFHPATYAHNLDLSEDELERRAQQTMIATYGQTPLQLFVTPHPLAVIDLNAEKSSSTPVYRTVTGLIWGNYVGSPAYPPPYVVWQQAQPFQVKTLVRLDSNQVVGLSSTSILVGKYILEVGSTQFLATSQTSSANVISWGHGDSSLYCRRGKLGEEYQVALLPAKDPVVLGASNSKVSTLWFGHRSGRISVFKDMRMSKTELSHVTTLHGHMSDITGIVLSPEYSLAVSCSRDGSIMTWDLHSQSCLHQTTVDGVGAETSPVSSVLCAMSESCGDIATAANSTLTLYTVNLTKVCQTTIRGSITALTFSHLEEGKSVNSILIGTQSGGVKFFSSWDLTHIRDVTGCPPSPVTALAFSLDCLSLVVSTQNHFVTILEKSGSHGLNRTPKYLSIQ